jgi:hypothetical protein
MSYFTKLLETNNLPKHDGRALWRYHLDADLFHALQNHLKSTIRLIEIDPRDCALYYAAWWKCCYNGGSPSKREIFRSIANGHAFDEETFYDYAKRGANLLGIRWIRNANTLYFRTLLLQGGLPVRHIASNQGAYTRFLVRILEMNPASVDDFAFDSSVTSLLPASNRNGEVYACCLDIVRAINAEDQEYLSVEDKEYLSMLEQDKTLNQISAVLRIKKRLLGQQHIKPRFRTIWVLEPTKEQIRLYLSIPDMDNAAFRRLFLNDELEEESLAYEYKLFYENEVLCKFIRNSAGHYKTLWAGRSELIWDGTEQFAELYLLTPEGGRYDCGHLIGYMPRLNQPTLWTKYSDTQWILERGVHTSNDEGMVLFPENFFPNSDSAINVIDLCNQTMNCLLFNGAICLQDLSKSFHFKTGCKKFDWHFSDERPTWMRKASLPVVRHKPEVRVYDEQGERVLKAIKRWRQKGERQWHHWNDIMPKGLIEVCIEVDGITEEDEFFHIGQLQLEVRHSSLNEAEIGINNNAFTFRINESSLITIENASNGVLRLCRTDITRLPRAIQASLVLRGQGRSLRFEIAPPFAGVEIIDKDERIVSSGIKFTLGNLYEHRLLSNHDHLVANLYNTRRPDIVLPEQIIDRSLPLKHFEDKALQLFSLSDPLDGQAEVVLEICVVQNTTYRSVREYRICRYTQKIECRLNETRQPFIRVGSFTAELYAVPVECPNEAIALFDLEQTEDGYRFRNLPEWTKYIVFGGSDSTFKIKPIFINLDTTDLQTSRTDRLTRIIGYRDALIKSDPEDDIWKQLLAYYRICVNNDLPFATFDVMRACSFSSELVAKLFLFLLCYDEFGNFVEGKYRVIEDDLGFFFHWASAAHWKKAMEWLECKPGSRLFNIICNGTNTLFAHQHPSRSFSHIMNYALQDEKPKADTSIPLNQKTNELRANLGPKVLSGIPQECPNIPEEYKHILPVNPETSKVKLLLKSPVAVALSIAGKSENLWCEAGEHLRRNVRYSYMLHPEWYAGAILNVLSKI